MLLSSARLKPDFKEQYQQQAKFSSPSYIATIGGNFLKQLIEPEIALEKIASLAGIHPHFSSLNDLYNAIQQVTETSGFPVTQKIGDGIASLLGFALNPINIALGGAGSLLAKGTIKGVSAIAPEFLSGLSEKTITKLSGETVGSLSEKAFTGSSVAATSLLPENLAESITPNNKLDVSHLISATSIAGGFGLALGAAPFAASLIRTKLFKQIETAEEKTWYQDYQKKSDDPELTQQAAEILRKNNPDLSINPLENKVTVPLLTSNDIKALQSVIPEELLARYGLNTPNALSNFIQKNALNRLKQYPNLREGLQGIVTELENKGEKDWHVFLSSLSDQLELGPEPLANNDSVKDYLKQRIENQLPATPLTEQRIAGANDQLKHYQDILKKQEELNLTVKTQPAFKKYQEFKNKTQVFQDLIYCLQRNA
ncbi:MAG: hypothetical protein CFE62_006680 [Candidatus Aquirickettsiella gammari]|uniref:Uncharacterized protein n=1 Tax=Candidatus Aquirickettsiella gammari TaxID=2016198 RepID=A0A370CHS4_9COXI|nr:MAG: hypothetical protein CFE62_006680 [Candidatus Aquirickettsiella gammari]